MAWASGLIGLLAGALLAAIAMAWQRRRPPAPVRAATPPPSDPDPERIAAIAAAQERERIYADLHDDLGARLLELIYTAPDQAQADRARAILQDLRDVVSRSRSEPGTLQDVLASIRAEAAQRLAAAGVELSWQAADDLPDPLFDQASSLHLHRIMREAISNAIRHAGARRLRVRIKQGPRRTLLLEITDEGGSEPPLTAQPASGGAGLSNMQARAQALQGTIDWSQGTLGGTKVLLSAPLPGEDSA